MLSHRLRYILITVALGFFLLALVAVLVFAPEGEDRTMALTCFTTAVGGLVAAFVDAQLVEQRRKDPRRRPISDDVTP
jgi:hypothetical protein